MIEAVIFDMDGVLIDSVESAHRVKTKMLKEHGVDLKNLPDPHNENHKGSSLKTILSVVEQHHGLKLDIDEFSQKAVINIYEDLKKNNIAADAALLSLLKDLKNHNVPLAIASAGLSLSVANKLRILGIKDLFQLILTANDVKEHKPHPEVYTTAMRRLGSNPMHTIIFEDSLAGIQAGLDAGAHVIGVVKYSADKKPMPGTDTTIDSWNEINYSKLTQIISETI